MSKLHLDEMTMMPALSNAFRSILSPVFSGIRDRSLVFCVMLCRSLFFNLSFFFIWPLCLLSVLRFADSDYPYGIFKHFLLRWILIVIDD